MFAFLALIPNLNVSLLACFFAVTISCVLLQAIYSGFKVHSVIIIIFLVYLTSTWVIGFSNSSYGRLFNFLIFFFSFILCLEFKFSEKYIVILSRFVLYLSVIMLATQIYILIDNPLILYQANFLDESDRPQLLGNTIYVMFLCFISYILVFFCKIRKFEKITVISLTLIYVILSGKTTSLLLFSFLLALTFIVRGGALLKIFNVLAFVVGLYFVHKFDILPEFVSDRIVALNDLFFKEGQDSSNSEYLGRFDLIRLSAETFLNNIFLGVGGNYVDFKGDFTLVYNSGIGHHSEFIDFLSRFGLIGAFFLVFSILSVFGRFLLNHIDFLFFSIVVFIWFIMNNAISIEFAFLNLFTFLVISNRTSIKGKNGVS
ncbi:O-antigen ligase family protein [Vibrio sp. 1CM8B]|uniref:O-antigen ligase family protein n=1 Tax=Vibrio sp. 1CM8B TaxID=2929167 RepID=UPI0020C05FD4|nr:O-antigen ligase family protein [Vibrio sp. 1CM8B]MCK8087074.1 hypothetical protein [Vibrio sp. 1CM8B]